MPDVRVNLSAGMDTSQPLPDAVVLLSRAHVCLPFSLGWFLAVQGCVCDHRTCWESQGGSYKMCLAVAGGLLELLDQLWKVDALGHCGAPQ